MNQALQFPDVLTVDEAARYLRVSKDVLKRLAAQGKIPGRKIDRHWRFLKAGLDDWLRGVGSRDGRTALLEQAGAFKDDETLSALRAAIYAARGRPEVPEESGA